MRGNTNGLSQKHASGLGRKNLQPASQRRACLCRVPDTITNSKIANLKELRPGRQSPPGAGSQKWEPTQSTVPRPSATYPESSRRSGARSSTQSDGDRHPKRLRNSLTRKRSLVQIQYGPRHFSKICLALGARMGASQLRVCPISAGHGVDVLVSAQGVLTVPVGSVGALSRGCSSSAQPSRNPERHAQ
jgi:hypothetical protein